MLSQINGYAANGVISPVSGILYEQSVSFTGIEPDSERYPAESALQRLCYRQRLSLLFAQGSVAHRQAGALANQLATAAGGTFFCNLVGTNLSSCSGLGLTGAGNYPSNFFQLNPFAAGGYITELSDPGSSSYNGLQIQWKHPTGFGLNLNANYTYSHALTNRYLGDYYTAASALVNYVTLRDPRLNRGPTPYDQRHAFRTFLTYQLPFGKGKSYKTGNSVVTEVLGGWTVGSIVTVSSGRNFKLQSGYNTYNYSNAYWPDASDSGVDLNGLSVHQLQSKVGLYAGPTPAEPKVFLPPSFLSSSGSANPSLIAPPTTPGQLGQFVFLSGPIVLQHRHFTCKIYPD
jgi:hypothetical protein